MLPATDSTAHPAGPDRWHRGAQNVASGRAVCRSWNGGFQTVEEAVHKIDVLYRHCEAVGRDPGEIQKTAIMLVDPMADLDGFLRTAEQYAGLGIDLIDVMPPEDTTDPVAFASRLGEHVIPRVAQLSVAELSEP